MANKTDKTEIAGLNSYDYAFLLGLLCGADCMQHEIEEEMRREVETFNRFVRIKKIALEMVAVFDTAIKTTLDRKTMRNFMDAVDAEYARLEADEKHR